MALVLTDSKHYHDIAEAIREKTGSSETYAPSEMANAIRSGGGGGVTSLDNTITFIDGSGEVAAIFTLREGVGNIEKPSGIKAARWMIGDTEAVFPLNPTSDLTLVANNDLDVTAAIFEKQEIDISTNPYLFIWVEPNGTGAVWFCGVKRITSGLYETTPGAKSYAMSNVGTVSDFAKYLMNNKVSTTNQAWERALQKNVDVIGYTNYSTLITNWNDIGELSI